MNELTKAQHELDAIASLIARDAVMGRLPSETTADRYWECRDNVERASIANRAEITRLQVELGLADAS